MRLSTKGYNGNVRSGSSKDVNRDRNIHAEKLIVSDFDAKARAVMSEIAGDQHKKDEVLNKRINKFFSSEAKSLDPSCQYFRQRREPDYAKPGVYPISTQLIIYGVDFLSTRKIRSMFSGLQIVVKTIDDSHCKVTFKDELSARAGLSKNLRDTPENKMKFESQDIEVSRGWYELKPYQYMQFQRIVWCRYVASNEDSQQIQKSNKIYKMEEAKRQYQESCIRAQEMELTELNLMKNLNFQQCGRRRDQSKSNREYDRHKRGNINQKQYQRQHRDHRDRNNRFNNSRFDNNQDERCCRCQKIRPNNQSPEQRNYSINSSHRQDRSRNKNNLHNRSKDSNLSFLSRSSVVPSRKQPSLLICEKPRRANQEDCSSSLSFLLNKSNVSNSSVINHFNKLNIDQSSIKGSRVSQRVQEKGSQNAANLLKNSSFFKQRRTNHEENNLSIVSQYKKPPMKRINTELIILNDDD